MIDSIIADDGRASPAESGMARSRPRTAPIPVQTNNRVEPMPLEYFEPNPYQPRLAIDPAQLAPLVDSIRRFGFIGHVEARYDPLVPGGRLQLVFGHRRFRAAELAGMRTIPTKITDRSDEEMRTIAYLENTTAVELTPWEEALYFKQMQDELRFTMAEIGLHVGKSKGYVQNRLDLLRIPEGSVWREVAESDPKLMTAATTLMYFFKAGESLEWIEQRVADLQEGKLTGDDLKRLRRARNMGLPMDSEITDLGGKIHTIALTDNERAHHGPEIYRQDPPARPLSIRDEAAVVEAWAKMADDLPPGPDPDVFAPAIAATLAEHPPAEASTDEPTVRTVHDRTVFAPKTGRDWAMETLDQIRGILPHLERRARHADFSALEQPEQDELRNHKRAIVDLLPV